MQRARKGGKEKEMSINFWKIFGKFVQKLAKIIHGIMGAEELKNEGAGPQEGSNHGRMAGGRKDR